MARVTVCPKGGGGWQVSAIRRRSATASRWACREKMGGGQLVVKGRDGRVRMQNTHGTPDPRPYPA